MKWLSNTSQLKNESIMGLFFDTERQIQRTTRTNNKDVHYMTHSRVKIQMIHFIEQQK